MLLITYLKADILAAAHKDSSSLCRCRQVINEEIRDLIGGSRGGGSAKEGQGADNVNNTVQGGLPLRENLLGEVTVAGLSQHEVGGL